MPEDQYLNREQKSNAKGHNERHVPVLFFFVIFHFLKCEHARALLTRISPPLDHMCPSFKGKSDQLLYRLYSWAHMYSLLLFLFRSIWRWKDLSCCFLLLHYLLLCGALLAGFHLRFRRLFLGKPLKCVSDSKQSSSYFLSPLAFSLKIKNKQNKTQFSKWTEPPSEATIHPILS